MKISIILMTITYVLYFPIGRLKTHSNIRGLSKKVNSKENYLTAICIILILVAGLRGDFARDYTVYYLQFKIYANQNWSQILSARDIGFALYSKIISNIFHSVLPCYIGMAFFMILFFREVIKSESVNYFLSLFLFIAIDNYIISFNLMRYMLIAAVVFYASRYIWKAEPAKYCAWILIATLMHRAAIVMIPMYWILRIDYRKKKNIVITLTMLLGFLIAVVYTRNIAVFVQNIIKMGYDAQSGFGLDFGTIGSVLKTIVIFIFILIFHKKLNYEDMRERVWFNACIYATAFQLMAIQVLMMQRMAYLVSSFFVLVIPLIISRMKRRNRKIVTGIIVLATFIYCGFIQNTYSYYFLWQNAYIDNYRV